MLAMEKKKYLQPYLTESLAEIADVIGCFKSKATEDCLSVSDKSSEEDAQSIFSKFTSTKRPSGFFGTQT